MSYTLREFKEWLNANPSWRTEYPDLVVALESAWTESIWISKILPKTLFDQSATGAKKIIKQWISATPLSAQTLLHWSGLQSKLKRKADKANDTKQKLREIKTSLDEFITKYQALPSSVGKPQSRPVVIKNDEGVKLLHAGRLICQETDFKDLQNKLASLIN